MAFGFLKKIFSFGKKEVIGVPQEGERRLRPLRRFRNCLLRS